MPHKERDLLPNSTIEWLRERGEKGQKKRGQKGERKMGRVSKLCAT